MSQNYPFGLKPNLTAGAEVAEIGEGAWRLEIPAGTERRYRLAQLDDYSSLPRRSFPWAAPVNLELRARSSAGVIPGTWGFGLWNDPFAMGLLTSVRGFRLPILPNAAWFFFASAPNYLSLRDDLQAQGWLAATFCSPDRIYPLLALGAPAITLLVFPPAARLLRRLASRIIKQDMVSLNVQTTDWHTYSIDWQVEEVNFRLDGELAFKTIVVPKAPLGLVLWIDNQYAAFPPTGRIRYGMLANTEPAWIEIADLTVNK
ncbi:hypothetical protein ACFLV7_07675 [Chloroflexota bacterium]